MWKKWNKRERHVKHQETLESSTQTAERLIQKARKLWDGEDGVAKDAKEAVKLYRQAIDLGNTIAMNNLGFLLLHGDDGVAKDVKEAVKLYRQAVGLGDASAMYNLGCVLQHGEDGVAKDVNEAVKLYREAAGLGEAMAMYSLAWLFENGEDGVAKDVKAAVKLYRQAADLGNAMAMNNLGFLLQHGEHSVAKDVKAAVKLYRKAAGLGEAKAMYNLGLLLQHGEDGVAKDVKAAVKLYRKAAGLGEAQAMYNLGLLLQHGDDGVAKDVKEAVKLYRQAAGLWNARAAGPGEAQAMYNLGLLLQHGDDEVAKDFKEAVKVYRQAASLWNASAMNNHGLPAELGYAKAISNVKSQAEKRGDSSHQEPQKAPQLLREPADRDVEDIVPFLPGIGISESFAETQDVRKSQARHLAQYNQLRTLVDSSTFNLSLRTNNDNSGVVVKNSVADTDRRKYLVFISHAGPDKLAMAHPICKVLKKSIDVHAFLDMRDLRINNCTGPEAMEHAMQQAEIGIFILSPEFASRKWTMRELRHFLERDRTCKIEGRRRPVVLPVFYRLSLEECTQADTRVYGQASKYGQILLSNGFFNPERQNECSTEAAVEALKKVTRYSGVELLRRGGGEDLSSAEVMAETVTRVKEYLLASNTP